MRILIVGDTDVGKTSLLVRFWEDKFTSNQRTTIGVDYKARELTIGEHQVKMQIWDTAGQERFRSMTAAFYNKAQGVMLVFDVRQRESFLSLPRWIEDIRRDAPVGCHILLCANKCDQKESKWEVEREEFEAFAAEYGIPVLETSGKSCVNVVEAFTKIGSQILESSASTLQQVSANGDSVRANDVMSEEGRKNNKVLVGLTSDKGVRKRRGCC
jgi:small GTP-binding protein